MQGGSTYVVPAYIERRVGICPAKFTGLKLDCTLRLESGSVAPVWYTRKMQNIVKTVLENAEFILSTVFCCHGTVIVHNNVFIDSFLRFRHSRLFRHETIQSSPRPFSTFFALQRLCLATIWWVWFLQRDYFYRRDSDRTTIPEGLDHTIQEHELLYSSYHTR